MPRDALKSDDPALAALPFSPGVRAGELLFISGQVGLDPETGRLVEGGAGPETAQCLRNLASVLAAAGKTLDDVVKANVYLSDIADYAAMNAEYARAFTAAYPARTALAVAALPLGAKVEIEAVVR